MPGRICRHVFGALALAAGTVMGAGASAQVSRTLPVEVAAAAQVARTLPVEVAAAVDESTAACKPDKVELGPTFTTRKDVNGDGILDYILDYSAFTCGDMSSFFCGSAGCLTQVFASVGGRYAKVFDENAQDVQFRQVRGRPAMVLGLHGSACGRRGSATCSATLFWNGRSFRPAN